MSSDNHIRHLAKYANFVCKLYILYRLNLNHEEMGLIFINAIHSLHIDRYNTSDCSIIYSKRDGNLTLYVLVCKIWYESKPRILSYIQYNNHSTSYYITKHTLNLIVDSIKYIVLVLTSSSNH